MCTSIARSLMRNCLRTINSPDKRFCSTFKAAVIKEVNNERSNLQIIDAPSKKLQKDEVRIQIHYCSVNSADCNYFHKEIKSSFVPGYEFSGEVTEVGKSVTPEQVIIGEKVAALSLENYGGFADECVVKVQDVWRLPTNLELKDAAVLICGHSTAYYAFNHFAKPKEEEKIVITVGPAGLGLAAVDVAANVFKAKVLAITDTVDRSELVRTCGAFETTMYHPKLKKDILKATNGGTDIIYDAVGERMLEAISECAKPHGHIFYAVPYVCESITFPPFNTSLTVISLHALRKQNVELYRSIVNDVLELANESIIGAHISAVYELKNVNDAIQYIEDKKCTGKVLIEMD